MTEQTQDASHEQHEANVRLRRELHGTLDVMEGQLKRLPPSHRPETIDLVLRLRREINLALPLRAGADTA